MRVRERQLERMVPVGPHGGNRVRVRVTLTTRAARFLWNYQNAGVSRGQSPPHQDLDARHSRPRLMSESGQGRPWPSGGWHSRSSPSSGNTRAFPHLRFVCHKGTSQEVPILALSFF
jgi:hypothetical protein